MSVFSKAKVVEAPAKKAAKRNDKAVVELEGLFNYAVVDKVVKTFGALQKTLAATLKEKQSEYFVTEGNARGYRPENFRGVDGLASASCELRMRSSASVLSDEECELLTKAKIPFDTVVEQVNQYVINPKYFDNQDLLALVSKSLEKLGLPDDFIQLQTEKTTRIVNEESLAAVFKNRVAADFLSLVSVLAIKPVLDETVTLDQTIDHAKKIIEAESKEKVAEARTALKDSFKKSVGK